MEKTKIILIGICVVGLLCWVFTIIAYTILKSRKKEYFDGNQPRTDKAVNCGNEIVNSRKLYKQYIEELGLKKIHQCSNSVVSGARNNNLKYVIKYSDMQLDEECLIKLDYCIEYYQRIYWFGAEMNELSQKIREQLPRFVRLFTAKNKISYRVCKLKRKLAKPTAYSYVFKYVSPAGKSVNTCEIPITLDALKAIRCEVTGKMNKKGYARTQRNAMTNDLREAIKQRDGYTCQKCGNSVYKEPNLLLEVDHIVPVSAGGKTEASNLQTLCWRCNREKSNKLM